MRFGARLDTLVCTDDGIQLSLHISMRQDEIARSGTIQEFSDRDA